MELSRFLPIVESLGPVGGGGGALHPRPGRRTGAHLHDFAVTDPTGQPFDIGRDGPRLAEAALAMWDGRAEVDSLNRLVLRAGMAWDDVAVLRAYRRYRSQVGTTFTTAYVDDVLVENAAIARTILELFAARFDPVRAVGASIAEELRNRVVDGCDAVPRLDHDRILRGFLALVDATLRTNRYLPTGDGRGPSHLALKFDSAPRARRAPPDPLPGDLRARAGGGGRAPAVGTGGPGRHPVERAPRRLPQRGPRAHAGPGAEERGHRAHRGQGWLRRPSGRDGGVDVRRAYEIFVSSLLEVTDNVVGDEVVGVPRRRDGDDPYLVVAADRGTATFSDLANRLSQEHGFWLGDAFASGGSHGYDHKQLGITARGAWVAVRHHFAELEIDLDDASR